MPDHDLKVAIAAAAEGVETPPFSVIRRRDARNRRRRSVALGLVATGALAAVALTLVSQLGQPVTRGSVAAVPSAAEASAVAASAVPTSSRPGVAATASGSPQPHISMQRSGSYSTVASLVADSSLVVYVTATSTHSVAAVNGLPFTTTIMRIDRVVRGTPPPGDTLPLQQIGPANVSDRATLVEGGHQYLAFLGQVSFSLGTTTGQWYVVGLMAGLYEVADGTVVRMDALSPNLPTGVSQATIEAAIAAAPTQAAASGSLPLLLKGSDPRSGQPFATAAQASAATGGLYVPDCPGHTNYYLQPNGAVVTLFQGNDAQLWVYPPQVAFISGPIPDNALVTPQTLIVQGQQGYGYEATPQIVRISPTRVEGVLAHSYLTWSNHGTSLEFESAADLSLSQLQGIANSCT